MDAVNAFEESIILFLQAHCSDPFISLLKIMTYFGDEAVLILVLGFIYWCYDKKFGMKMILYLSISNVFYPMIKNAVKRIRPYMVNEKIQCLKPAYEGDPYDISVQGYSFPSGHMVNSACVYAQIFRNYRKTVLRIVLVLVVFLLGLSRVCLGLHYPSDVIAGFLFGIVCCNVIETATGKIDKKIVFLILTVLGGFGFLFCRSNDFFRGYGIMTGAMAANLFEVKYVKFKETTNIAEIIIRMLGGVILYVLISETSQLPFTEAFLNSGTTLAFLVRAVRYFLIIFCTIGIYPLFFKYIVFSKGGCNASETIGNNGNDKKDLGL